MSCGGRPGTNVPIRLPLWCYAYMFDVGRSSTILDVGINLSSRRACVQQLASTGSPVDHCACSVDLSSCLLPVLLLFFFCVKTVCLNGALVVDWYNAPAVFDLVSLKVEANLFRHVYIPSRCRLHRTLHFIIIIMKLVHQLSISKLLSLSVLSELSNFSVPLDITKVMLETSFSVKLTTKLATIPTK